MIGGATTSALHTALKISPLYSGPVLWLKDASQNCPRLAPFLNASSKTDAFKKLEEEYESLRSSYQPTPIVSLEEARRNKPNFF
jgi:5-methyltetrahydrofolate--homocysteine methyltransferase